MSGMVGSKLKRFRSPVSGTAKISRPLVASRNHWLSAAGDPVGYDVQYGGHTPLAEATGHHDVKELSIPKECGAPWSCRNQYFYLGTRFPWTHCNSATSNKWNSSFCLQVVGLGSQLHRPHVFALTPRR